MISPETRAQIRRYFYAEHWKIGTIARQLGLHPDTVRNAIETGRVAAQSVRPSKLDPYLGFLREVLSQHPTLRATRIYQMARERGYTGSVVQFRRAVARLRPQIREPFLRLETFPGEQGQVDWAHFGHVQVGRARRALSCFVMTLSYSRALYLEFFFDQTTENFLRGHVHAFEAWDGAPRVVLYDNLKSAVLERRGSQILFNPRLIELTAHYHFSAHPCQVRAGNQKGRVERAIRYVRDSFWAGRSFTTLAECNRQAWIWRDQVAHQRRWPGEDGRAVQQVFADEQPRLIPLPAHRFNTDRVESVCSRKSIYIRFDLNDYSIPPDAVGRPLTLVASDVAVRLLDGTREIASHPRTYDRQRQVFDPAHREAVLAGLPCHPGRPAGIRRTREQNPARRGVCRWRIHWRADGPTAQTAGRVWPRGFAPRHRRSARPRHSPRRLGRVPAAPSASAAACELGPEWTSRSAIHRRSTPSPGDLR